MAEGLRERKRRAAHRAMETAAVRIAYAEGVDAVTVDRICAAAMVSRSTFFNYFTSLEVAIFGSALVYDRELTDRILSDHSDDLVIAASLIVMHSVRGAPDDEVAKQRFALFAREPGVSTAVSWSSHTSRERLIDVIEQWLDDHPEHARSDDDDHRIEARLTVGLSIVLGDEAARHLVEIDGDLQINLDQMRSARRRMAGIGQLPT